MPEETMALVEIELLRDSVCRAGEGNYLIVSMHKKRNVFLGMENS